VNGRSVEEIREEVRKELQGDPEENYRKVHELMEVFALFAIKETMARLNGQAQGAGAPAWIVALVKEALAEAQPTPISEIVAPPPAPAVIRKRRESPIIDEALNDQALDTQKMAETTTSDAAPPPMSAACPEKPPAKSVSRYSRTAMST
jgi:hypothetical protein